MIKKITNVDSKKGSGKITFTVDVKDSADEKVSTKIDDKTFETKVKQDKTGKYSHSITHTKPGRWTIMLTAEKGKVNSASLTLDL